MDTLLCYSKDEEGRYQSVNQAFLSCIQAGSPVEVIGLTDKDLPWGHLAEPIMINDQCVISSGSSHIFFEKKLFKGEQQLFRSFKTLLVNASTNGLTLHGHSVPVSDKCQLFLTHQQSSCLKYMALGFTQKEIAELLGLSHKTVEHYLEAVKLKLSCKTRSELMMHALERGLVGIF